MCMLDAALVFYPIAAASLVYTGVRLWRKYNESKTKTNAQPPTTQ